MKKYFRFSLIQVFLIICVFTQFNLSSFSQTKIDLSPDIWLRADSSELKNNLWRNIADSINNGIWSDSGTPEEYVLHNFNKSLLFSSEQRLKIPAVTFFNEEYTSLLIYNITDSIQELALLGLCEDSLSHMSLTTQQILYDNDRVKLQYCDTNTAGSVANLFSSSLDSQEPKSLDINIGNSAELEFNGQISEYVFFNRRLSQDEIGLLMSYASIKYNINLLEGNYINSFADVIWDRKENKNYSYSVSGVGKSKALGLNQKQTYCIDSLLIFGFGGLSQDNESNSIVLKDEHYVLIGSDKCLLNTNLEVDLDDNKKVLNYGRFLLQASGDSISNYPMFVQVDASSWKGSLFDYRLFVVKDNISDSLDFKTLTNIYTPVEVDTVAGVLYFDNLYWDTDKNGKCLFGFMSIEDIEEEFEEENNSANSLQGGNVLILTNQNESTDSETNEYNLENTLDYENSYILYPNPSSGEFKLQVNYETARDISVRIFTVGGRLIRTYKASGQSTYDFEDFIPQTGHYTIEIDSGVERKSIVLIVNK